VYKRQIYQIAESNRNFFCPNWNALDHGRGVGTAGATGALAPAMWKPRGREYLIASRNIFSHFCMLFLKLPLFVVMLPTYN